MKKHLHFIYLVLLLSSMFIYSCKKEDNPGEGQVEFSLTMETGQSILKSASIADSTDAASATSVIITIEDANGVSVKNSEKLDLYFMNGSYITQPISLLNGNYKLTRFLVLDSENNVIYASPLEGSDMAYLVEQTLPLGFNAQTDVVTKLTPQVVRVSESTPKSFGYTTFSFDAIETFDFLVGAFVYNDVAENYELTSADISIYSNSALVYNGQLSANTGSSQVTEYDSLGVNNRITLPESYDEYTLVISKTGYKTYTKTFAKEELKLYYRSIDKGPLVVVLEAEQPGEDEFYIRGYFGNEYLNYTFKQIGERSCHYTSYYRNDTIRQNQLGLVAYEGAEIGSKFISLSMDGSVGENAFNIDNMTIPYTFMPSSEYYWGQLSYQTDGFNSCVFCENDNATYFGITKGSISITIESKSNDIVVGKFSGSITTITGKNITVSDGEFRGKFKRIRIDT